ncbi:hypothetical protein BELL_0451g00100 [Botrytis elliptica]|uniref:Uncharacterized protein n=1 Tax=Botrytis elliptica TaxID=278938 RepID=A0A4Z1JLU9_9HELO|nr:hypothetical protein BELL_0451g00100 [Botrytis elliptica]
MAPGQFNINPHEKGLNGVRWQWAELPALTTVLNTCSVNSRQLYYMARFNDNKLSDRRQADLAYYKFTGTRVNLV